MNKIDTQLLIYLMQNGRSTWSELAESFSMSAPGVADKVRRLEERGTIQGYAAQVNPTHVGIGLMAFVNVTLDQPSDRSAFLEMVQQTPHIQGCYHVAGAYDYLLLIRCRNTAVLETLLTDHIKALPGTVHTNTTIVLSTVKETAILPIENGK
ncbi:MAG: Lrp/AsnC family transcriptional regulator [Chloroflexi bacterium]|nr:MAG: Lrp/AsnC family transcriptional regulator [Chloroflexota bacterium]